MSKLLELLVSLSVAGSTVVACILLLRLLSPGVFPSRWRYAIGKMAVGLYVLPVALVMQWLMPVLLPQQPTNAPIPVKLSSVHEIQPGLPTAAVPELNLSADIALVLLSIWGTGVFIFAMWQVYCYRRFIKKLQQTRSPVPENSEAAKQLASMKVALGMQNSVRSVTQTHQEDPSIPPGTSITIRTLTPEEIAAFKKRQSESSTPAPEKMELNASIR